MSKLCDVYAVSCAKDGGVVHCELSHDGKLSFIKKIGLDRPMYLIHEDCMFHTLLKDPDGYTGSGYVCFDESFRGISPIMPTNGLVACHLCKFDGGIYTANYMSGSITRVGVKTVVHKPYPNMPAGRQDAPHTHCIIPTPDGRYLMATDLGLDTITVYDAGLNVISVCNTEKGHGVRHIICGENNFVYSANELSGDVSVFSYDDGSLTLIGTYSSYINAKGNTAAAIWLSDDKKYLYVSQRGEDVISSFAITGMGKDLSFIENVSCGGRIPRDFRLTPGNEFMLCANEGSGDITVFEMIDGRIGRCTDGMKLDNALCVLCE